MNIMVERGRVKGLWSRLKAWYYHRTGQAYIKVSARCPECHRWVDVSKDSWTLWEGSLYHSVCLGWDTKKECQHGDLP